MGTGTLRTPAPHLPPRVAPALPLLFARLTAPGLG